MADEETQNPPETPDGDAEEQEPAAASDEATDETAEEPAEEPAPEPVIAPEHEAILARLQDGLDDGDVVAAESNHGDLIVRVTNEAWHRAGEVARQRLDCEYLSFVSGIDWMPRPMPPTEDPDAPSVPVQPQETTYGVTGSEGRFQALACVESTDDNIQIIFKADLDESDPVIASWTDLYPGADWHERECWEMYGFRFDGHPHLRHLYLPGEFEGHPLRKDYPLLAREVKPWPGLVDVELMPEAGEEAEGAEGAEGEVQ